MNFLKKIFRKADKPIETYSDFWNWFQANERTFYKVVKNSKNIEKGFFNKLYPKLDELKDGFYYLSGMIDDNKKAITINSEDELVRIYQYCKEAWDDDKDEDHEDWEDKDEDHEGWGVWGDWDEQLELTSLFSDCFEVNYPITLILEDGSTQTINSKEEAMELFRSTGKPSFAFEFPVNITIEGEAKEIASLEQLLETVLKTCIDIFQDWEDDRDEEDWEHDDREDETEWTGEIKGPLTTDCFQLNYPVTLQFDNGTSRVVNSKDEIIESLISFYRQPFTLQFPVNIILEDEERKEVNSLEELDEIYKACIEGFGEWEDDDREDWLDFDWEEFDFDEDHVDFSFLEDCFKVNYPISVTFENRGELAINNNDELKGVIIIIFRNAFGEGESVNSVINYPVDVTLNDGSTETLNSDEDLWKAIVDCK